MKKVLVFLIIAIFLISFISAGITGSATEDNGNQAGQDTGGGTQNQEENQITTKNQNKGTLTQNQVKNIIQNKNQIKIHNAGDTSECPNNCTCTGSATKCWLNGQREMTIEAGNSGNTIVQVKGIQAQTQVQLYKDDGKLYGQFKGNVTKRILSPEQIQEKIQNRLQIADCSCENMELDEDGYYQVQTKKEAKFLGLFKVREKVRFKYDAGNGELVKTQTSWWGFLAKDVEQEPILGATCGTVSPTGRDECCQNRGYDIYDSDKGDCVFFDTTA